MISQRQLTSIGWLILLLLVSGGGCSRSGLTAYSLPSGKQIKIVNITPMHFKDGENALVMNCQTDLPMNDRVALRKEAGEIWEIFKSQVEKVKMSEGIIHMVHPAEIESADKEKGTGFIFVKRNDGKWHCLQDERK